MQHQELTTVSIIQNSPFSFKILLLAQQVVNLLKDASKRYYAAGHLVVHMSWYYIIVSVSNAYTCIGL